MARFFAVFVGGLLLLNAASLRAADNPVAGNWKFSFAVETERGARDVTFLIALSNGEKGWTGKLLGMSLQARTEPKFESVKVEDDKLTFTLKVDESPLTFEGRIAKDGKKIRGVLDFDGRTAPVEMVRTELKSLEDKYTMAKEFLDLPESERSTDFFDVSLVVLGQATAKKLKVEEARVIVDKALKAAEMYGPRWEKIYSNRLIPVLADQEALVPIALELARQAERNLKDTDSASVQMETLGLLALTLKKAKKLEELKPIESRLAKLETRDFMEYSKTHPPFKPEEFKGRKGKGDKAVLVELFTGTECPPCVAANLAFDALQSTYKPADVVLLEYHMHIPGPDPLTNPDGVARFAFYKLRGTPGIFFNGKKDDAGGGPLAKAKLKYDSYREIIDEMLEKPAGAKIQLSASQTGAEISIKANVSDVAEPGESVMLRFALVEERVSYAGGNGLRFSHNVVRNMPGGVKGVALTKKSSEHTASVNLDKLREDLSKYLADFADKEGEFPNPDRPLALKNLRVVAFVQNDTTNEVLQSVQVDVEEKK